MENKTSQRILPEKALSSLRENLNETIGEETAKNMSDYEVSQLGYFFLTITAIQLKIHLREQNGQIG
jgi:hypothetical protein